ncbi:MAG: ribonucleoside-diphosphate reductase, adenosylcobalamin-dependent, partial [Methylovulum sp.]|nr:ribonucleoside-diphosphate reductase, adenosylcobalamin-dependent [Methylovulum sp.]
EHIGREAVFDTTQDDKNTLVFNGLATGNCGEQPLPPYGSCLLGSINLTRFVKKPFTADAYFDWDTYRKTIKIFTRMLDNVVELNGLPLAKQREEITSKRRHGMGYLGLGSTVTMLGMRYGDTPSLEFTEEATKVLAVEGWKAALSLAKEKGPAPIMEQLFTITGEMLHQRPEMLADGYKIGDQVPGKILHTKYSRYMQKIAKIEPELVQQLTEIGARFTHHSSIAPTGTISLSLANNASNGIEPSFAHHYSRNIIRAGKKSKEKVDVYSFELLAYRYMVNADAMPYSDNPKHKLPAYFIAADDVTPKQHVDIQAAAQKWIDSSISKTANVPTDYPYEDFKSIYQYAYEQGLKGCTTFRFNPEVFQGVLVKESDLENTTYQFTLDDGSVVEFKGNEEIEYDGEIHTAANLFDALKEGYYGKF